MRWIISGASGRTYNTIDGVLADWEQGVWFWVSHCTPGPGEKAPMMRYVRKGVSTLAPGDTIHFVNLQHFAGVMTDVKVANIVADHGIRLQPPLRENEVVGSL